LDIKLKYHGWCEGRIEIGMSGANLTASYLSDGIGDLVRGLQRLRAASGTVRVSWANEPGELRWVLDRVGNEVTVRILWFDDYLTTQLDDEGRQLLSAVCKLRELIGAVATGTSRLLRDMDEDAYEKQWGHPFPGAALTALNEPDDGHA
jgi:hypothetical protein